MFAISFSAIGQKRMSTEKYIDTYKAIAIKKMKEYKIPASITLAQGILESGSGNSRLAVKGNNHFGIKCHKGWKGQKIYEDDDAKHECFRKYKKAEDSYSDHSDFLTQRGRYSFLFEYKTTDYKKWAYGLKKAGYATNPKYPELLIRIIEKYDLDKYDKKGGSKGTKQKVEPKSSKVVSSAIPSVADYKKAYVNEKGRQVFNNNKVKLIVIKKGDTFNGIAKEFDIYAWQLYRNNDVNKKHILQIGEVIYLEKKKRKANKKYKNFKVRQGDSMQKVSQIYGVRLSRLYKMNNMADGVQPEVGKYLKLR